MKWNGEMPTSRATAAMDGEGSRTSRNRSRARHSRRNESCLSSTLRSSIHSRHASTRSPAAPLVRAEGVAMRRKVGWFLLSVMVAVSLGATIVASIAMSQLVSRQQADEIRNIETSLGEHFALFETMLRGQHERITARLGQVLPRIAAELGAVGRHPSQLSAADLDAMVKRHGIQNIYFINRSHTVFQTNLATDMNLSFGPGPFTRFLDSVFGADKVMSDGIDLSMVTGTLRTYSYFNPAGKDYIIEISTDVRTSLAESEYSWMSRFFFEDFFTDPVRSH